MTRVKICGLKHFEDALVAVEAGADMLGFVFAPSRRQVDPQTARDVIARVRERSSAAAVGIFVNADPQEMNRIAHYCALEYVQLSGEVAVDAGALDVPVIQAIHVDGDMPPEILVQRAAGTTAQILLLDTARKGAYGGTGETFDWSVAPSLDRPVLLAGGLSPSNVAAAIRALRPWGVDVSSGVETDGRKDHGKIRAFIQQAKLSD